MNILVVTDSRFFDQRLAREIARLAANSWANITLLGTITDAKAHKIDELQQNLVNYQQAILDLFPVGSNAIDKPKKISRWQKTGDRFVLTSPDSIPKRLELVLIQGDLIREIYLFSNRHPLDLLVLGGDINNDSLLVAAATEAADAVLVVKGIKAPKQIVCCLNHEHVTPNSLKLISRLVTLYNTRLKIVGFSNGHEERTLIESKLVELLHYFNTRKLTPWLEMVDASIMPRFILQESEENLVAIWVKKNSHFNCRLPQDTLVLLINDFPSSVLLLH